MNDEIAAIAGVSPDTIVKTEFLQQLADAETIRRLRKGETSVNAAVKDVRRKQKREGVTVNATEQPTGKYRVIYADPPWE